jgi:GDP-D-mannose dehydratase
MQGSLILHERSPINPKSIYATAKVAADFLTMNYFDAFGCPRSSRACSTTTGLARTRAT